MSPSQKHVSRPKTKRPMVALKPGLSQLEHAASSSARSASLILLEYFKNITLRTSYTTNRKTMWLGLGPCQPSFRWPQVPLGGLCLIDTVHGYVSSIQHHDTYQSSNNVLGNPPICCHLCVLHHDVEHVSPLLAFHACAGSARGPEYWTFDVLFHDCRLAVLQ